MGKEQRIEELEKRVAELEARIVQLETRPIQYRYPQVRQVRQVRYKPTEWLWQPPNYLTTSMSQ